MGKTKKITISGIDLDVYTDNPHDKFVPNYANKFIETNDILRTLAYAIKSDLPVLLVGETGVGKTSAVRHLAKETNNSFRRLNLNGQTTVDEFVGKTLINEKGTYWVDGVLTEAMREGHWLLLDELNAALPEVLFVLQSLLDDDRYIVLSDKDDKEIVRPHENFRVFATMNPADGYVGTKDLNKALMSRFPLVVSVPYPQPDVEVEIIAKQVGLTDTANPEEYMELQQLVEYANSARDSYLNGELDFPMSTRELVNWARAEKFYESFSAAAEHTFLAKCNPDDRKALASLLDLHVNAAPSKKDPMSLQPGDKIIILQDIPVPNQDVIIPKRSMLEVESIQQSKSAKYGPSVRMTSETVPQNNHSNAIKPGETWSVQAEDLKDKFMIRK